LHVSVNGIAVSVVVQVNSCPELLVAVPDIERIAPEPPVIHVPIDIKPQSCPNPLNTDKKGVVPVAVLGTEDFDVTTIDPETIKLTMEGLEVGVSPLRWAYEDVGTPFEGELCDCHDAGPDGILDLTVKFKAQELVETLGLEDLVGETEPLLLTGNLKVEHSGTAIQGSDCMRFQESKGKK